MREEILSAVVIRFQICIFDILNTAVVTIFTRISSL